MSTASLSFEQAPPLSVPLRFFLTAPLFGIAAGLLLALHPEMLASRWMPALLGATHLMVLGVLVMVVLGALMQVLPVAVGVSVPLPRQVGAIVHVAWTCGTISLAAGLTTGRGGAILAGAVILAMGATTFLLGIARLATAGARTSTTWAIRLACAALAAVVSLGLVLAAGHAGLTALRRFSLTDVHLAWGLVGLLTALVMGVSWQVVPMLLMTPEHPRWLRAGAVPALAALLAAWSFLPFRWPAARTAAELALVAVTIAYAVATLLVLAKRRRKVPDPSVALFRFAMVALALAGVGHVVTLTTGAGGERLLLVVALLHVMAFASCFVVGMLLKIVPFLCWMHLQAAASARMLAGEAAPRVPTTGELLPVRRARLLVLVHAAACILVVLTPLAPALLGPVAGPALAASFALLFRALLLAARLAR